MVDRAQVLAVMADVATAMAPARHPWWIISSAALVLHGIDPGPMGDVDLLFDLRDVPRVLDPLGLPARPGVSADRFRSQVFASWPCGGVPVELFAGFELREAGEWSLVLPSSRVAVSLGEAVVYTPDLDELRQLFLRFGRAKDLARAALISPSGPYPSRQ